MWIECCCKRMKWLQNERLWLCVVCKTKHKVPYLNRRHNVSEESLLDAMGVKVRKLQEYCKWSYSECRELLSRFPDLEKAKYESHVERLMLSTGFPREDCEYALEQCNFDNDKAAKFINEIPKYDPDRKMSYEDLAKAYRELKDLAFPYLYGSGFKTKLETKPELRKISFEVTRSWQMTLESSDPLVINMVSRIEALRDLAVAETDIPKRLELMTEMKRVSDAFMVLIAHQIGRDGLIPELRIDGVHFTLEAR